MSSELYQRNHYSLDISELNRRLLADPDVHRAIDDPENGLNSTFIYFFIQNHREAILTEASREIASYNSIQDDIQTQIQRFNKRTVEPGDISFVKALVFFFLVALAILSPFLVVIELADVGFVPRWISLFLTFARDLASDSINIEGMLILFMLALIRLHYQDKFISGEKEHLSLIFALKDSDGQSETAKAAIDEMVFSVALKHLQEQIERERTPIYQNRLFVDPASNEFTSTPYSLTVASGLSEVLNIHNEVPTEARKRLLQTIEALPGACIGICGPRGIGKSTLLWSLCGENQTPWGEKAISLHLSAPVEYDTREFLLHLFASLCRHVLRKRGATETHDMSIHEAAHNTFSETVARSQTTIGWILVRFGLLICAFGMAVAALIYISSNEFLKTLGLKPGAIVSWGGAAFLMGLTFVVSNKWGQFRGIIAALNFWRSDSISNQPSASPVSQDELIAECRATLHDIRFQQSYSSGWSGGLKFPAGFETSGTMGLALAQKQQGLPELIQRFRECIALITKEGTRVIIGIDELDKFRSGENVQQFVNEIKAIFNIPNCFYLITVSENAISNFERRGMPVRDAFDSAFDDIHYVDYLSLQGSRNLLRRRVSNLPDPFVCLCHSLSAGLPRDLIRVARSLLDFVRLNSDKNDLPTVAHALIRTEAKNKARAILIAARDVFLEPEVTKFLTQVSQLESALLTSTIFPGAFRIEIHKEKKAWSDVEKSESRKLRDLNRELSAFLHFSRIAIELFSRMDIETRWKSAVQSGYIERLTRARQALELNTGVAVTRLSELDALLQKSSL